MSSSRPRRSAPLVLTAAVLGAVVSPGAALADGPGYGGTADTLTVQWQPPEGASAEGLAVYALGFRGGSPVSLRVGSAATTTVTADLSGAVRVLVVDGDGASPTPSTPAPADAVVLPVEQVGSGRFAAGMVVSAIGETPAGMIRSLVGAIPPAEAGTGVQDVAPWGIALAALAGGAGWLRRRGVGRDTIQRYRHPARHRAA
jgi:hypothetical protein